MPTAPTVTALVTDSVGFSVSSCWPPSGDFGNGACRLGAVPAGGAGDGAAGPLPPPHAPADTAARAHTNISRVEPALIAVSITRTVTQGLLEKARQGPDILASGSNIYNK